MKLKNNNFKFSILTIALCLTKPSFAQNSQIIDILPNASGFYQPWGNPTTSTLQGTATSTYGQVINPTPTQTRLMSFTFAIKPWLDGLNPTRTDTLYRAGVYSYDYINNRLVNQLFITPTLTAPSQNQLHFIKIDTGGITLAPNPNPPYQTYALIITTVGQTGSSNTNYYQVSNTADAYDRGYFIYNNNTDLTSVFTGIGNDLAFRIVFAPLSTDTLNSFRPNAFALRSTFNLQSANISQSLSYDCTIFDEKNICVSFTGTRSDQNGSNLGSTTGTLVLAHRTTTNVRFGGYINQSLNTSEQGGLRLERSKPGVGAFVNYALTSGLNIRGSVGLGKLDMQTTREAIDSAEAGVGKSNITTQGAQLELSKAFDIKAGWTAMPYAGLRKVTNKRAGYSETASDLVSTPLTFAELKQTQTTAFGGIRFLGQIAQQTQLLIIAGVEHDSSRKVDDYAASGIDGLGSITMQDNLKKSRPVFAANLSYDITKNERASIGVLHRQEAFDMKRTTTVGFTYMKGF